MTVLCRTVRQERVRARVRARDAQVDQDNLSEWERVNLDFIVAEMPETCLAGLRISNTKNCWECFIFWKNRKVG